MGSTLVQLLIEENKVKSEGKGFCTPEGYWVSADYCLDPESVVITKQGEVMLKDLKNNTLILTPWGYKRCFNVRNTGVKKVVKITLNSGETLKCSPDHKICVKRDGEVIWTKAISLRDTDYIFSINNTNYINYNGLYYQRDYNPLC